MQFNDTFYRGRHGKAPHGTRDWTFCTNPRQPARSRVFLRVRNKPLWRARLQAIRYFRTAGAERMYLLP